jgi:uncharacterized protein YoxC
MNAALFRDPRIDFEWAPCHTSQSMTPLAQAVIVICVAVVSAVLVSVLLALKKTALRAESVLHLVEREIQPMLSQLESLTSELRELSKSANEEMRRISVIVRRADDVSIKVSKLVGAMAGLTTMGQYISVIAGMKKGVNAFVGRLRSKS